jgi:hypothetical protein
MIDNRTDPEEDVQKESNDKLEIYEIDGDDRYGNAYPNRHDKLNEKEDGYP